MKVYIVTSYDGVVGVFSTREKADEFAAKQPEYYGAVVITRTVDSEEGE